MKTITLVQVLALSLLVPAMPAAAQQSPLPPPHPEARDKTPTPGTVTSPNTANPAIAKVEAAGKNPNPGPLRPQVSEPNGPNTAENNPGVR